MAEVIYKAEAYEIIGACFEVYNEMGCGFAEAVYQECLTLEFTDRRVVFEPKRELKLSYKGKRLEKTYEPDFVCFDKIIVEIKAVTELADDHRGQVHNYLKATGFRLGLLVNFGGRHKLESERIVR